MTILNFPLRPVEGTPEAVLARPERLEALEASGLLDGRANAVLDRITRLATRLLGVRVSLASLVTDVAQHFPGLTGLEGSAGAARGTPLSHSYCQYVVRHGAPFVVDDSATHPLVHDNPARVDLGVAAYAGVPLRTSDGEIVGAFCAISTTPRHWEEADLDVLADLAAMAMAEIELRIATRQLLLSRERSLRHLTRDPLTGLHHRYGFLDAARPLLERARRERTPCVLLLLEIDAFREVNARHGYVAGDALLLEVSTMLTATFRDTDLVARTSSDEFAVLVTQATAADIPWLEARLDAAIEVHNASPTRDEPLVVRTGVAAWDPSLPTSITSLLQVADSMLQRRRAEPAQGRATGSSRTRAVGEPSRLSSAT